MIFARKTKAFYAYEARMMRPRRWPPTQYDVSTLWERAKALFAATVETIGSVAQLVQRWRFGAAEARALNARLRPVEKLVRMLMMSEAVTLLLMTPEGGRMRREAKTVTPPSPPPPPAAPHSRRILMPGWQTIAALQPRIDPRVVEREERERREALERAMQTTETVIASAGADGVGETHPDPLDPETWRTRFQVVHWDYGPWGRKTEPPRKTRVFCATLDADSHFPILDEMVPRRVAREKKPAPEALASALAFARRIETLSRLLGDPRAAIRQLARRLASLPPGSLETPYLMGWRMRDWHHGLPELWNALNVVKPAVKAFIAAQNCLAAPPPEPG